VRPVELEPLDELLPDELLPEEPLELEPLEELPELPVSRRSEPERLLPAEPEDPRLRSTLPPAWPEAPWL